MPLLAAECKSDLEYNAISSSLIDSVKLFKYHILAVAGILFFFQGVLEAISANYSTSYYVSVENGIGLPVALTSLIFMTVGMAVGRFALPVCLKTGGRKVAMFLFMAIAFIGALLQYLMNPTEPDLSHPGVPWLS